MVACVDQQWLSWDGKKKKKTKKNTDSVVVPSQSGAGVLENSERAAGSG